MRSELLLKLIQTWNVQPSFCRILTFTGKWLHGSREKLLYRLIICPRNHILENVSKWFLPFWGSCIRSFGALLDLELQENDNIIFWKNLNKGSIWSPFPRTWLLGARFRCHGSVSRKPGSHFPVIDNTLQHEGGTFQVWVKTNSGLIQNWFWSDSKLIEIWFKTDSDLIKNCFKLVQILFKTEFGCPFTLLIMHAVERRLWHF